MMAFDPFADLNARQRVRLNTFGAELARLNKRLNLVSPATIPYLRERHLVHSLALAVRAFPAGATVVDFGAGGGLPTVPLAIRFPEVHFVAVDAVGKKMEAVRLFARRLSLDNLTAWTGRAEAWPETAHYAVSRATAPLSTVWGWFERVRSPLPEVSEGYWPPGLVCLKGGDLAEETAALHEAYPGLEVEAWDLLPILGEAYFEGKAILHVFERP